MAFSRKKAARELVVLNSCGTLRPCLGVSRFHSSPNLCPANALSTISYHAPNLLLAVCALLHGLFD